MASTKYILLLYFHFLQEICQVLKHYKILLYFSKYKIKPLLSVLPNCNCFLFFQLHSFHKFCTLEEHHVQIFFLNIYCVILPQYWAYVLLRALSLLLHQYNDWPLLLCATFSEIMLRKVSLCIFGSDCVSLPKAKFRCFRLSF